LYVAVFKKRSNSGGFIISGANGPRQYWTMTTRGFQLALYQIKKCDNNQTVVLIIAVRNLYGVERNAWVYQQGVTPMTDETPYIIVDNRKISPIERSPRLASATADRPRREEQTFGVVDRVTISREARERSLQPPAYTQAGPPALEDAPEKPPAPRSLLTYSPKHRQ
jgi:hypothetical protein